MGAHNLHLGGREYKGTMTAIRGMFMPSSIAGLICAANPTRVNPHGWPSYMCMLSSNNIVVGSLANPDPG